MNLLGFVRDTLIRDFLADPWISQGISLRYLFIFIGLVRDILEIPLYIHGSCREYAYVGSPCILIVAAGDMFQIITFNKKDINFIDIV